MRYRSDIDGLRAVAVVSVVLFHANVGGFQGGFIGVDVFFVVSGYLITSLIWQDLQNQRFSIVSFYERRVRRIIPALLVVSFACAVLALAIHSPGDVGNLGASIYAAALFFSNLHFMSEGGYFDESVWTKPLLHTWSLSVEEQFYVAFPIVLLALFHAARNHVRIILLAGLCLSLLFSVSELNNPSGFFLPTTRAWELLIGALLALAIAPRPQRLVSEIAAFAGFSLIAWSVASYTDKTPFPGIAALAPCLGAALIIHSGSERSTLVSNVLSWRPFVFIGLISYSLYLWHWPVFTFARYWKGNDLGDRATILCIALSLIVAWGSWRLVEVPIRNRVFLPNRDSLFKLSAVAGVFVASIGLVLYETGGLLWLYPERAQRLFAYSSLNVGEAWRIGTCSLISGNKFEEFSSDVCLSRAPKRANILLLGDSHAAHLWKGLSSELTGINVMQANATGCRPVLTSMARTPEQLECVRLRDYVFWRFMPLNRIDAVILAAAWHNDERDLLQLPATIRYLQQFTSDVLVVGPIVSYDRPLPDLLGTAFVLGDPNYPGRFRKRYTESFDDSMEALIKAAGAKYLSAYQTVCPSEVCITETPSGVPLQFDKDHLTSEGAAWLVHQWRIQGKFP